MRVLGIETSCDETGVAVYDSEAGLLAHDLYSQVRLHADFGGVVPELASRDHVRKLVPLINRVMERSGSTRKDIQGIAYTSGPGLIGALMVGASVATGLARSWGVPALGVHHMEGHLLAPMLEDPAPTMPFLALLVSGGHSAIYRCTGLGAYEVLGETVDDAAGEAYDKVARMMGLGYPGGPVVDRLAAGLGQVYRQHQPPPGTIDRPSAPLGLLLGQPPMRGEVYRPARPPCHREREDSRPVPAGQQHPRRRLHAGDRDGRMRILEGAQLQDRVGEREPLRLDREGSGIGEQAHDHVERLGHPRAQLRGLDPQHPRVGEQIEKMVGIDFLSLFGKVTLLLGRSTVKVVSHEGWPRGGWGGCLIPNILTNPKPTFFFAYKRLAHHARIAGA